MNSLNKENSGISYIVSSFKKPEMLELALERLIKIKNEDDEVLVFDGNSGEQTISILEKYKHIGLIDFFESKQDIGEAHAYNKAILQSNKDFIKLITDDDIFFYKVIEKQKNILIENSEIDIIFTNGISFYLSNKKMKFHDYSNAFKKYFDTKKIDFCGLGFLIRKSAFAKYGIFDTRFIRVDYDLSYRFARRGANIGYLNDLGWIRIESAKSNSLIFNDRMKIDPIFIRLISENNISLNTVLIFLFELSKYNFTKRKLKLHRIIRKKELKKINYNIQDINYDLIIKNAINFSKQFYSVSNNKQGHFHSLTK